MSTRARAQSEIPPRRPLLWTRISDLAGAGAVFNWSWGVAWRDPATATIVVARVPLNWIAGWVRLAWFRLQDGPRDRMLEAAELAGYQRGRADGVKPSPADLRINAALSEAARPHLEERERLRAQLGLNEPEEEP
jgi:hypothetical protein